VEIEIVEKAGQFVLASHAYILEEQFNFWSHDRIRCGNSSRLSLVHAAARPSSEFWSILFDSNF
jgi:hypothetical protein